MKYIISKELLSEVLGFKCNYAKQFEEHKNLIYYSEEMVLWNWKTLNIYELAHKCKEWALKNGNILNSGLQNNEGYKNRRRNKNHR